MSLMQIRILPFSSITTHSFFIRDLLTMSHYATPCPMFRGMPPHFITMELEQIQHPSFQEKTVKSYYQDLSELSTDPGLRTLNKLGLVVPMAVMLDPVTEQTIFHPKLGNCPFCFSIDQLYAHCKYDMCKVPVYDGSITGNMHAYHVPWWMQHDCIINPRLLACAFGHLPQPYEWDENEATGLDFSLQWSGPKLQHMIHRVLDPNDIRKQLSEHLAQWHERAQHPIPSFNATEQLLLHIVDEDWSQAAQHFLHHHAEIDPRDEFSPMPFVSWQLDVQHLPIVGGAL